MLLPIGRVDGCVLNGVAAVDHDPITDVNADVGHTGGVIRPNDMDNCIRVLTEKKVDLLAASELYKL